MKKATKSTAAEPSDTSNPVPEDTKRRLLREARRAFACHGVEGTSIRALARAAGVNVAAVNYHFGDKSGLYRAVLTEAFANINVGPAVVRIVEEVRKQNTPEAARLGIRKCISELLHALLRDPESAFVSGLVLREGMEPTLAMERTLNELILPAWEGFLELVTRVRPDLEGQEELRLTASSILSQVLYWDDHKRIALFTLGKHEYSDAFIDEVIDHIGNFSLAALGGMAQ